MKKKEEEVKKKEEEEGEGNGTLHLIFVFLIYAQICGNYLTNIWSRLMQETDLRLKIETNTRYGRRWRQRQLPYCR